ncbi:MAG: energy transducer TonB, partial [Syntrophales bacterium LBB04]|nr:energy transducer TonB [Syntrophales bacterium LBB04]
SRLRKKVRSSQLTNEHWWTICAAISVVLHIAMLSMLMPMKSTHNRNEIEVFVVRETDLLNPAKEKPKKIASRLLRQQISKPNALQPIHAEPLSPQLQLMKKMEEPGSGGARNVLDDSATTRAVLGSETGAGNGVAIGGAGVGSRKAGGAGIGGAGVGGKSAGSGEESGSSFFETGFGQPDGPQFLRREIPEYPFAARRLHKEGKVVLMLIIDEKGKLLKVDVIKTSDKEFAESAVEAIKKSTFLPARKKGVPVVAKAILPIRFSLQR